jgi:copper chaperone CopZ
MRTTGRRAGAATATSVVVEDLQCPCCADEILDAVRALPGVRSATLDYQRAG